MTFKVIRGQGQGEEMTSVPYRDYSLDCGDGLASATHPVLQYAGIYDILLTSRLRQSSAECIHSLVFDERFLLGLRFINVFGFYFNAFWKRFSFFKITFFPSVTLELSRRIRRVLDPPGGGF